jgi:hypothetical protein
VQVVSLAIATGQLELARETLLFARKRRIGREIEPGGEQPEELRRSNSWHYSIYNLEAFVALAGLGDAVGVDLWHYETPDGRSLRKAIAWLVPSALGKRPWTTPQMGGLRAGELAPVLRAAAARLGDEMFAQAARTLGGDEADRLQLFLDWK